MLFLLVGKNPADFETKIAIKFPGDYIQVHPGAWIISAEGSLTSKDVWDRIVGTETPTGIIVAFTGYYGRESSNIWEWVAAKRNGQT